MNPGSLALESMCLTTTLYIEDCHGGKISLMWQNNLFPPQPATTPLSCWRTLHVSGQLLFFRDTWWGMAPWSSLPRRAFISVCGQKLGSVPCTPRDTPVWSLGLSCFLPHPPWGALCLAHSSHSGDICGTLEHLQCGQTPKATRHLSSSHK